MCISGDGTLSYGDKPLHEIGAEKLLELRDSLESTLSSINGAEQTDGSGPRRNETYAGAQQQLFAIFVYMRVIQEIERREIIK